VGRALRVGLIAAGIASGYYAVKLIRGYSGERRRPEAFPAERADDLLNPLRAVFMPARRTLGRFDLRPGQTVLELGPGPGYYTMEASQIVGPTGHLLCLDVQPGMIERLVARLRDGDRNFDPLVGDAMRLPLRDGGIDRAFLVTVLGEIPDASAALAELRRVLAPDGTLAIDETMRDPDYVRVGKLQKMCAEAGFVQIARHRSPLGYSACFRAG
jgi:ubiquinone/menaquinone biosynthesis C-methylase UbiE